MDFAGFPFQTDHDKHIWRCPKIEGSSKSSKTSHFTPWFWAIKSGQVEYPLVSLDQKPPAEVAPDAAPAIRSSPPGLRQRRSSSPCLPDRTMWSTHSDDHCEQLYVLNQRENDDVLNTWCMYIYIWVFVYIYIYNYTFYLFIYIYIYIVKYVIYIYICINQ